MAMMVFDIPQFGVRRIQTQDAATPLECVDGVWMTAGEASTVRAQRYPRLPGADKLLPDH